MGRVGYKEGRCVNGPHWLPRAMTASVPLLFRPDLYMGFSGWVENPLRKVLQVYGTVGARGLFL